MVRILAVSCAVGRLIVGLRCGAIKHSGAVTEGFGGFPRPKARDLRRTSVGDYHHGCVTIDTAYDWHTRSNDGVSSGIASWKKKPGTSSCRKDECCSFAEIDPAVLVYCVFLKDTDNTATCISQC